MYALQVAHSLWHILYAKLCVVHLQVQIKP